MGRKVNPPNLIFFRKEKMGWDVVVRKPARPKRSPALLVCVLIQKGGMKRRSGRFPYFLARLPGVRSPVRRRRTGERGRAGVENKEQPEGPTNQSLFFAKQKKGLAPRPPGRGGGARRAVSSKMGAGRGSMNPPLFFFAKQKKRGGE